MSTLAETYVVKLNYEGQMRRFPVAMGTSFKDLRDQVLALLSLPKDADVLLKYSDEEGDLITISSDLELTSALVPGKLLRLTVIGRKGPVGGGGVNYPPLDAPMLDVPVDGAPVPSAPHAGDAFRSFSEGAPVVGGPTGFPPGFVGGPDPHAHPHEHPLGFGGPHRGGHYGPFRGGPGCRGGHGPHGRGGFGHHGRGGFGPHGRGFHGHGPYMHPHAAGVSREDWRSMRKEDKEARREMKREWKEAHKSMKREWKQGGGRGFQCADGMQWGWAKPDNTDDRFVARFAKDVTIPDGTQLQPKTPFVKTWRLRNEGPAWPAGCVLRFLGKHSDNMGSAEAVPLPLEIVAPNTEVEVSVNLVAPEKPGRYTGYWKMCTPDGRKFGQRVWVSIVVPGSPNSTSSSSSDSDREADRYESLVDTVLATGMIVKRHRILRMLKKYDGNVNLVCEKLAKKDEKKARKAMKKQMKI